MMRAIQTAWLAMAATLALASCAAKPADDPAGRASDHAAARATDQAPSGPGESASPGASSVVSAATGAPQAKAPAASPLPPSGSPDERAAPRWIALSPRVRVDRAERIVEFDALAVLDTGFLEQYVCTEGTREHESLFVFEGKASEVHAALLLAGHEAGTPGRWREVAVESPEGAPNETRFEGVAPLGSALTVAIRLPDGTERPLPWFVRAAPIGDGAATGLPPGGEGGFVFSGSRFHRDRRTGIERYVADGSGSLIGLVTFGDETIGPREVVPDQASVATPMWEVWPERMPGLGTRVVVVLRAPGQGAVPSGAR